MLTIVYPNMMWLDHFISNTGAFEKGSLWHDNRQTTHFTSKVATSMASWKIQLLLGIIVFRTNEWCGVMLIIYTSYKCFLFPSVSLLYACQITGDCDPVVMSQLQDREWWWCMGLLNLHWGLQLGSVFYSTPFIKSRNSVGLRRNMYNQLTLSCHFILVEA